MQSARLLENVLESASEDTRTSSQRRAICENAQRTRRNVRGNENCIDVWLIKFGSARRVQFGVGIVSVRRRLLYIPRARNVEVDMT